MKTNDKKNGERPGEDELVIVEVARPPILLLWLLLLRKGKPENRLKSGDTGITGVCLRCMRKVKQIRQQMCETTLVIDIKSILANKIYMISTCMTRIWQSET